MIKKCNICNKNPATVNYVRNGKTYYRKLCYHCIKQKKADKQLPIQLLKKSGYKKKTICDRCGFKSKIQKQIKIYYRDQNPFNVSLSNLRSYCLNCMCEVNNNPALAFSEIIADY